MKYEYAEGIARMDADMRYSQDSTRDAAEERSKRKKETVDDTLKDLEDDYNRCYRIIRKTYDYLERIGLQDFNKFSKYKWSFDRDRRGFSYVCVRDGSSLLKKSLVKRSGSLEESELLRWLDTKNLVCEALDEAYEYIDERIGTLKFKMNEMKERIQKYEDWGKVFDEDMEAVKVGRIDPGKR